MRYGYVRTSTNKQHTDRQIIALKKVCDELIIEDGVSARKKVRPKYNELMERVQTGDEFIVQAYDRAFRSVIEGLTSLDELTERGVKLKSLTEHFDPTSSDGRMHYTLILMFSEWEVNKLSERTVSGLKAAILRGEKLGRPCKDEDLTKRKRYRSETKIHDALLAANT